MFNELVRSAKVFHAKLCEDEYGRFMSWEHCYNAFAEARESRKKGTEVDINHLSLHLAFYLASWGMYRGSSFLLQRDYRVHRKAVEIVLNSDYDQLLGIDLDRVEVDLEQENSLILNLYKRLIDCYEEVRKTLPEAAQKKFGKVSDTLITKIMLGTLGCVPAYDQYFKEGIVKVGEPIKKSFSKESLRSVVSYIRANECKFETLRRSSEMKRPGCAAPYPPMKLIDLMFWKYGLGDGVAH